tara:strand:+ start:1157 stop:3550 length:2394 start_codon:yes stop_codon:yes gene_type:complete
MSRKIYNEIVLQWNDKTQSFDTLSEDSYLHDGPIAELRGRKSGKQILEEYGDTLDEMGDEMVTTFSEAFDSLAKVSQKAMKKAIIGGASKIRKQLISTWSGIGVDFRDKLEKHAFHNKKWVAAAHDMGVEFAEMAEGTINENMTPDELYDAWHAEQEGFEARLKAMGIPDSTIAEMKKDWETGIENLKIKSIEDNLKEGIKDGVASGFSFIPDNALTQALGLDRIQTQLTNSIMEGLISDKIKDGLKDIGDKLTGMVKGKWAPMVGFLIAAAMAFALVSAIMDVTDQVGESFGATGVQEFQGQIIGAQAAAARLGYEFDAVVGVVDELGTNFGVGFEDSLKMSKSVMDTAKGLALSVEESAKLTGMLMTMGGHSAESAKNFMKQAHQLSVVNGIAPGVILKDMAEASEDVAKYTKGTGENIAEAAIEARKMGLSLSDAAKVSDSLLDFQSSIQSEMEASILLGKNFNFQRARELALAGEVGGAMKEVISQLGDENEWNALNSIQREAIANSIGMSVESMAKMYKEAGKTNAELSKMREMNINELAGADAISALTNMKNVFESIKIQILAAFSAFVTFGGLITADSPMILQALSLVLGIVVSLFVVGKLASWAMKLLGMSMSGMIPGLTSLATVGNVATPVLFALGLVGLMVVGILYMIPPIIDSIANALVKMSEMGVGGIIGLTLGFIALSAALIALAAAFFIASPALVGIMAAATIGAGIGALIGLTVGGGDKGEDSPEGKMRADINDMKNAIIALSTGFGVGDGKGGAKPTSGKITTDWTNALKSLNLKVKIEKT